MTAKQTHLCERLKLLGFTAEAARMLGVSRSDIGYKISKYEIGRPADAT